MRFGFQLPHFGPYADPDELVAVARKADALEFDSIWVMDHLIMPEAHAGQFSANVYEPFAVLSYLAGVTKRVKLGTSVIILPYRNPFEMAKIVATLDVLSNGRVIFGAGVGWMEREFDILGIPFRERGARTDEYLQLMKELWSSESPNFQGRFYQVSEARSEPRPLQKPHPPVWIGGMSCSAIGRAVAIGDGWHPMGLSPEQLQIELDCLTRMAEEKGRDPSTIDIAVRLGLRFTEGALTRRYSGLSGSPEEMVARIEQYQKLGVSTIVVDTSFDFLPPGETLAVMDRFSADVLDHISR